MGELGGRVVKEGDKIKFTITQSDKGVFFMKHSVSENAREIIGKGSWCTFKLGPEGDRGPQADDVWLIGAAGKEVKQQSKGFGNGGGYGGGVWKPQFQKHGNFKGKGKGKGRW